MSGFGRVWVLNLRVKGGFGWPKMSGLPVGFSGFGSLRASLISTSDLSIMTHVDQYPLLLMGNNNSCYEL